MVASRRSDIRCDDGIAALAARSRGDDFVRIAGPDEGLRLLVMIDDEAVDGGAW